MRIYFIGDSLTRGTFRNKGAYTYLDFANRLAGERNDVFVEGVDGITAAAWVSRYPTRGLAPDLAFVMLGTNDAAQNVTVEEFLGNLKLLRDLIPCEVVFLTPPPTLHEECNLRIKEYAEAIKGTFPGNHLDLTSLAIPRDGFFPDGVHLLTKGHDVVYDAVKAKLEGMVAGLTDG